MTSGQQEQLPHLHLIRRIATGGMGEVWEARHSGPRDFEKRLAVKKILPHLTADEEFIDMFLDEGRLVAQLDHPNICQLFRLGHSDGTYYMEMEYVDGIVLTALIDKASRRRVTIPIPQLCEIAIGVCAGLEYAHSRVDEKGNSLGIIHRDISPPNVMVSAEGYVKILDFGIAKARTRLQHTQPGLLKGKLGYVSPEQVAGLPIDHRSDIFCLGILLWEMATCRRLFYAEDELATLRLISEGRYQPPSVYRKDLPPEFEWIIIKALSTHREDRFQSCGELQQALEDMLFRAGIPGGQRRLAKFVRRLMSDLPLPDEGFAQPGISPHATTPAISGQGTEPENQITPAPRQTEAPIVPYQSKHRVLVTDDEQEILDAVALILSSGGYEVVTARDGLEAVERVREEHFDACMLDLDMPHLDGRGALEQIRTIQPSLPCIIQTANASFHMATEMGRRGAVTYLLKPARRKAVRKAVEEALRHRPSGAALDAMWLSEFPTPLAEARSRFRELPNRPQSAKVKHALLAAHFELFTSWLSAVSFAAYLDDGAFSRTLNAAFGERAAQLSSDAWLQLFADTLDAYASHHLDGRVFPFHTLVDLFSEELWQDDAGASAIQQLCDGLTPLLGDLPHTGRSAAWDAMMALAFYHRDMWRHDALLDDQEVAQRVDIIDAFLTQVQERTYRMIDYNVLRVDGISATDEGFHHDLLILRGQQPESQTYTAIESLEARQLYIAKIDHRPLFSLSPFWISSPCTTNSCQRNAGAIAFPVQLDPSQELLYRCSRCGLLRKPGALVLQKIKQLFARLEAE